VRPKINFYMYECLQEATGEKFVRKSFELAPSCCKSQFKTRTRQSCTILSCQSITLLDKNASPFQANSAIK
jgi:hypothetical protein